MITNVTRGKSSITVVMTSAALLQFGIVDAQEVPAPSSKNISESEARSDSEGKPFEQVVVTATTGQPSQFRSSISVSTLNPQQINQSAPSNAADILRNVPGLIVQASGGEGNANITVRGLPQAPGAKFMQFQEDGMPVLDFGDIDFATADTFVRYDYNVERLEVIRGGSSATLISNAPGGVFNFISKTGNVRGGNIGLTRGVDFDHTRVDFDYGKPIDDRWRFHFGGFYRTGEGPRTVGYNAESGGQFKGNVTREFDNGYVRLNIKLLNDRAPVYLPVPFSILGTNENPRVGSLAGFDVLNGAMQSPYFRHDISVDRNGNRVATDIADGYYSKSNVLGGEALFDLANNWTVEDKFRLANTSGRFVGPYPAEVNTASMLAQSIGGAGATLRYATGPRAGQAADPTTLNGNGLAIRTHLFDTTLNNLNNYANDLKLTKTFKGKDFDTVSATIGYFKSRQYIVQDWHWNTYLQEVNGKNSALLDVVDANGSVVTQNGLAAYGEPFWNNCCVRYYDLRYNTDAPYLSVNWKRGPLNVDGSLRYDTVRASGTYAGSTGTTTLDVNGDGTIQPPERNVPIVNNGAASPVNYKHSYLSYSLGSNYLLSSNLAVFARISEGGRANAERVLFGGGIQPDGSIAKEVAINMVRQLEGGAKWRSDRFSLFATLFHATTEETNQDITSLTRRFTRRTYDANGLELEGAYRAGSFSLTGGMTYTNATISQDELTPQNTGNRINPRFVYQFTPAYSTERLNAGVNIIGISDAPINKTIGPAYRQVNVFANYALRKDLWLSVNGNNIFNAIGVTEIPSGSVSANGLNTARSINGRTILASLRYAFK